MRCLVGNKRIYFIAVRTSDDILTRFAEDDLSVKFLSKQNKNLLPPGETTRKTKES